MARNQKLTGVIQGRMVKSLQSLGGKLLIDFDDGSTMTVKASGSPSSTATGGTVQAVRQQGTELNLDMEDGSTLTIQTAEPTSSVMVRDKNHSLEYAD